MLELDDIKNHPLFFGIDEEEMRQLFVCFSFRHVRFKRDEYIFLEGDPVSYVGVVLTGTLVMEKSDPQGNNYFFTEIRENELFGDAFIGSQVKSSTVNYKAMTDCSLLIFEYRSRVKTCLKSCRCHLIFSENLMNLLALKTRSFMAKIEILSTKSLRSRILRFLHIMEDYPDIVGLRASKRQEKKLKLELKKNQVFVPLNHTELAEYLGVNRSALERELTRMKKENLLSFEGHLFTLHPPA